MNKDGDVGWFTLSDLLISVASGGVFLLFLLALFIPNGDYEISSNFIPALSLVFLLISFIAGEIIHIGVSKFYFTPVSFRQTLNEIHPKKVDKTKVDKIVQKLPIANRGYYAVSSETREHFWTIFKNRFGAGDEFRDSKEIYLLVLNSMESEMGNHTKRCMRMSRFCLNTMVSLLFYYSSLWVCVN